MSIETQTETFDRKFFTSENEATCIGSGAIGGKAAGLLAVSSIIKKKFSSLDPAKLIISIPRMTIITTDYFDEFMDSNDLYEIALSSESDERIAQAFQQADLPVQLVGDLRSLAVEVKVPLAIRSSSSMEDALNHPFAGVYATKMVPNNEAGPDERYRKLCEAIKFVYASTFFDVAKRYGRVKGIEPETEKMAIIVQEIVGCRNGDYFYPDISGVGRTFNYYAFGHGKREDGTVALALGLGKSIVDGSSVWNYTPAWPKSPPPFCDINDMLKNTQRSFWSVRMKKPPYLNPLIETEYLEERGLEEAEKEGRLRYVASTYDGASDRVVTDVGIRGPRIINFAPILVDRALDLNDAIVDLLAACKEGQGRDVEIEFAVTLGDTYGKPIRIGLLQVRPMAVMEETITITDESFSQENTLLSSNRVLGNGRFDSLTDVVYVDPRTFDKSKTRDIASEVMAVNDKLIAENRPYILLGFGRWGTSDPWRGIPVAWSHIAGAKVVVEIEIDGMEVELSQGSHFFHNVIASQIQYFSITKVSRTKIDWDWLHGQSEVSSSKYVRHVRCANAVEVLVDGLSGRGVILYNGN